MLKLLNNLKTKDKWIALLCLVLIVAQVWLDLKLPDYMTDITVLLTSGETALSSYTSAGGRMLLCALISVLLSVIVGYFAAMVAADFSFNVREKLFSKVSELGKAEISKFSTASLITRTTNDITQIQTIVAMGLQVMIKAPILAVWAVVKIIDKSFALSAVTAGAVIVALVIMIVLIVLTTPKFKLAQKQIDSVNRITRENLTGIRVIRAFNAEAYQEAKFDAASKDLMRTQRFTGRVMGAMDPALHFVQSVLTVLIYYVGAGLVGRIDPAGAGAFAERSTLLGEVVTFNSYALYVFAAFIMLLAIFMIYPRAQVSANRINEVLEMPVSVNVGRKNAAPTETGTVEFRNVSFRYPDASADCLKNISFRANRGETVAIIGATGSGKSTLLNLAARLYDATEGEVLIDGVNVKECSFDDLYKRLGYATQKAVLFSGDIRSNVTFGQSGIADDEVSKAAEIAQMQDFIDADPDGLSKEIAQSGANLSGGQKQRLSIARAIARKPEILLFDDTFSALDYATDQKLRARLAGDLKGTTCLIVSQRVSTIRTADRILVLDDGAAVGLGTHEELMHNCAVYREIARSQGVVS